MPTDGMPWSWQIPEPGTRLIRTDWGSMTRNVLVSGHPQLSAAVTVLVSPRSCAVSVTLAPDVGLSVLLPVIDQFTVPVGREAAKRPSSPTPMTLRFRFVGEVTTVSDLMPRCPATWLDLRA